MKFRLSLLYLITALTIFGNFALKVATASPANILVSTAPQNPAPYENTTINLKSFAYNLDSVLITWSVDGKNMSSGIGKKSFSINAPAAGAEINVVATLDLPDGIIQTKIIIKPSVMVLLWQANDSYVPPFYKGKALPTPDSELKIVAMPEIRTSAGLVDSRNMTYAWKKDYTNNVNGSGYGRNAFLFINDYLEDSNTVSVVASTIDQKYSSSASVNIGTKQPKILFYKNDNVLGTMWQNSLSDTYRIKGPEVIEAVPYFISPKEIDNPTLVWNWFINNDQVSLQGFKKNLMPLQAQEGTSGTSPLKLEIENRYKIFGTASKEINIEF